MDRQLFNHFVETEACADQSVGIDRMLALIPQIPGLTNVLHSHWQRIYPRKSLAEETAHYATPELAEFYAAMSHAMAIGHAAGYDYAQAEAAGNISEVSLDELPNMLISTVPQRAEAFVQNTMAGWIAMCPRCTWFQLVTYRKDVPPTEPKPLEIARAAARGHRCEVTAARPPLRGDLYPSASGLVCGLCSNSNEYPTEETHGTKNAKSHRGAGGRAFHKRLCGIQAAPSRR